MGTISARPRKDGTLGYTAQIKIKRGGRVIFSQGQTFDREVAAKAWMAKREKELARPGGLDAMMQPSGTLEDVIGRYVKESRKAIGRTKAQVLESIKGYKLAAIECERVRSEDIVSFARELGETVQPQTVMNYLSHLSAVFAVAKPAWGFDLDRDAMRDAMEVCKRLGMVAKSGKRDRRPTIAELNALMAHFEDRAKRRGGMPMHRIIAFATYSSRRQEEITRIRWDDLEAGRVLVRDMKNPGEKIGNNVWCVLPPEAEAIARAMPKVTEAIFPVTAIAISAAFTRACALLGIEDLHFHDLRHEGASRLFEMGWTIPRAAEVTGHRSWQSLQRYSHLRQTGDKLGGWAWLAKVVPQPVAREPS